MTALGRNLGCDLPNGTILPPAEVYPAGVELTWQGTPAPSVYLIESGAVKLVHLYAEGREIIVDLRSPGGLVGASSVVRSEACVSTAVTAVRSRLARWPAHKFMEEIKANHLFSIRVISILSWQSQELSRRVSMLGHGCARAKLLHFLTGYLTSEQAPSEGAWTRLRLPLTQRELAQFLALSPWHLSKVWTAFEREALVRRATGQLSVHLAAVGRELNKVRQGAAAEATGD